MAILDMKELIFYFKLLILGIFDKMMWRDKVMDRACAQ